MIRVGEAFKGLWVDGQHYAGAAGVRMTQFQVNSYKPFIRYISQDVVGRAHLNEKSGLNC